jgi:hypothetical protein
VAFIGGALAHGKATGRIGSRVGRLPEASSGGRDFIAFHSRWAVSPASEFFRSEFSFADLRESVVEWTIVHEYDILYLFF